MSDWQELDGGAKPGGNGNIRRFLIGMAVAPILWAILAFYIAIMP